MPTITKRYNRESLLKHPEEIIGKKINIVFLNKSVAFVECLSLSSDILEVKNMRQKKQKVSLQDIQEIIIDSKA